LSYKSTTPLAHFAVITPHSYTIVWVL